MPQRKAWAVRADARDADFAWKRDANKLGDSPDHAGPRSQPSEVTNGPSLASGRSGGNREPVAACERA
jgi:hypothetical protein